MWVKHVNCVSFEKVRVERFHYALPLKAPRSGLINASKTMQNKPIAFQPSEIVEIISSERLYLLKFSPNTTLDAKQLKSHRHLLAC